MLKEAKDRRNSCITARSFSNIGGLFLARHLCFSALILRSISRPVFVYGAGGPGLNFASSDHTQATVDRSVFYPPSRGGATRRLIVMNGCDTVSTVAALARGGCGGAGAGHKERPQENGLETPAAKRPKHESATDAETFCVKRPTEPANGEASGVSSETKLARLALEGAAGKLPTAANGVCNTRTSKRENYLVWDDYFMSVAFLSAMRSKDPSTQVGACIVNGDKRIVGIGYNGFPMGCSDDELPWARVADDELDTKYPYVCHAEMNAILNKNSADVKGCLIYVALFPCNECAKLIIQSGIQEVVYLSDKYHDTTSMRASRKLFELSGVRLRQHVPKEDRIIVDFSAVLR